MSQYNQFIFESYAFDAGEKKLSLHYSLDGTLNFTETYDFAFDFSGYDPIALDRAVQSLFFIAGVSYYKTYVPPEIVVKNGQIDAPMAEFLSKTYQRGLGEFWYVNKLDPRASVTFPVTTADPIQLATHSGAGQLVGVGGGKDSLASIELLRRANSDLMTWSLNHRSQLEPLVERIGLPHAWVGREWDAQLGELNRRGALNGHVPISAIFACVGTIVAILTGRQDSIVSNESTASEPNLTYQGVPINHQYSKSLEFEQDFQAHLHRLYGDSLRYYSLLRPFTELRIAEMFTELGFEKYKDVFSSCNRAFVHSSDSMFWCGECAKCAFVFLAFIPFVERGELEGLWNGKNLLLDPGLEPTYRQLLGIEGDKPLDCVGEVKESRAAMRLAQKKYPELARYQFELPEDYDYAAESAHSMPPEIYTQLKQGLTESGIS